MNIDVRTFSIVLCLTSFLQAIALYAQYLINKTRCGLGWWTLGNATVAIGLAIYSLRESSLIAESFAIIANNILFVAGLALIYFGVRRFLGRQIHTALLIALFAVYTLLIFYFLYIDDSIAARRAIFSAAVAGTSFMTARSLLLYKTRPVAASANFLALVFLVNGVFFFARALFTLTGAADEGALSPSPMQTATFLVTLGATTLCTFGFITLVNQRLNTDNREAKENLELIFNTSPDAVLITSLNEGYFVEINEGFMALSGHSRPDVIGKTVFDVHLWYNPDDRQMLIAMLKEKGFCENLEVIFRRKDGSLLNGMMSARIIVLQGMPYIISVTHDITERKRMEAALRESEEKYRFMTENSSDVIWHMDQNYCFDYISPADERLRGFEREEVIGTTLWSLLKPEGVEHVKKVHAQRLAGEQEGIKDVSFSYELEQICKDGSWIWTEVNVTAHFNQDGELVGYHGVTRDITDRKRLQEKLHQQATTDEITGIFNRRHFLELAQSELKRAIRNKRPLAIVLFDIDYFKQINDTYGHAVGDQALRTFTEICQKSIRESDVFARFGGDEFALLLPETNCEHANKVVERIRQNMASQPVDLNGNLATITISLGLSCLEREDETLDRLLGRADMALYQAKEEGRNRVIVNRTLG